MSYLVQLKIRYLVVVQSCSLRYMCYQWLFLSFLFCFFLFALLFFSLPCFYFIKKSLALTTRIHFKFNLFF